MANKEVSAFAEAAKKKKEAEQAALFLMLLLATMQLRKIRCLAKAKIKASSDSGGSSEKSVTSSDDRKSNARLPTFESN